jgi:peptidoglycan/LPS O-acetylase OafA/YrhL
METSTTKSPEAATRPYFPELDGLRAIAALMVMVFHFAQTWGGPRFLIVGQTGVDLFFALSGFLITTILLQSPHGDWHEVRSFYLRRTLRIFPLYYFALGLYCVVFSAVSGWYWVYLQNILQAFHAPLVGPDHFWSLGVEEQFYLVWPFLVLFWPRRGLAGAMWAAVVLSIGLRIALVHTQVGLFYFTPTRLDGLAGGALLAYGYSRGVLERYKGLLWGLLGAGVLSLGAESVLTHGSGMASVQVAKFTSAAVMYVAVIGLLICTSDTWVHLVLRCKPGRGIGRVSYGMYVYHPMIFGLLPGHLGGLPLVMKELICFATTYGVAVVSFYGFEKRFIDLKDRFASERPFRNAATAGAPGIR